MIFDSILGKKIWVTKRTSVHFVLLKMLIMQINQTLWKISLFLVNLLLFQRKVMHKVRDHFNIVGLNFPHGYYCLIVDGTYFIYYVIFNGDSSGRKIRLVHTLLITWVDVQHFFSKHSESKTGIRSINRWITIWIY